MLEDLINITFPITDPTWIFFLVLCIILFAPLLLGKLNIPHIIGLILAGVAIGEHGLHLLDRDSSFALFGNVGLYYIMFLAGLEMNMENFKSIRGKAITFGVLGFIIPMIMGYFANVWFLGYGVIPAVLIAAMYASHTLVSYPIVTRYGVSRHKSVSISVGATAITDCLTLFVLAIVSGQFKGDEPGSLSWLWLIARVAVLGGLIIYFFPRLGRWFFRKYSNGVVQFIFVLALVFLSAGLMKIVGMEGILGAFLAGLVLNRLIPHVSPLMHNIEFVGNALFVPYFLIGVGMLINLRVFFGGLSALKVAFVMIAMSLITKWVAAWVSQKICHMTKIERQIMLGLSTARAAATLAVVLVGYNIILPDGSHLLSEEVLNGAVALILVTCIVSSFVTERAARTLALDEEALLNDATDEETEKIMVALSHKETTQTLINLSLLIRNPKLQDNITAMNVVTEGDHTSAQKFHSKQLLADAQKVASSAGVQIKPVTRFGVNIASGIIHAHKEQEATELIVGLHRRVNVIDTFMGGLTESLLSEIHREVLIVKMLMPFNTIRRIIVAVPPKAEYEAGFTKWVDHMVKMSSALGCRIYFHATEQTLNCINKVIRTRTDSDRVKLNVLESWDDLLMLSAAVNYDHLLVVVSARRGSISYDKSFEQLPAQLARYFANNSLILLYPDQFGEPTALQAFADPMSGHINPVSWTHYLKKYLRFFNTKLHRKNKEKTPDENSEME